MRMILAIVFLIFISCKDQLTNDAFVSSEDIVISKPRINTDSVFFLNSSNIKLFRAEANIDVRYTLNGKEPTLSSNKLDRVISVNKSCVFSAKTFREGFKPSETVSTELFQVHGLKELKIASIPLPNNRYKGIGTQLLNDIKKGSYDHNNGREWIGYDQKKIDFTLEFKKEEEVGALVVSFLENHGAWIFAPAQISVYENNNLLNSSKIKSPVSKNPMDYKYLSLTLPLGKYKNLSIRVEQLDKIPDWHPGSGKNPWFFIDEILVL